MSYEPISASEDEALVTSATWPVKIIGSTQVVSTEVLSAGFMPPEWVLAMWGVDNRSDEQKAIDRALREEQLVREGEKRHAVLVEHERLLAYAAEWAVPILELHAPYFADDAWAWVTCEGCDVSGCEAEQPGFPCRTYTLISETCLD